MAFLLEPISQALLWALNIGPIVLVLALAVGMFMNSSVMMPPSEYLCIFGGVYAVQQPGWFFAVLVASLTVANLLGTSFWYALGVARIAKRKPFLSAGVERIVPRFLYVLYLSQLPHLLVPFSSGGGIQLLWLRNVPFVRSIVSYPAGYAKMPKIRFLFYSFAGIFVWTFSWSLLGYIFGNIAYEISFPIAAGLATIFFAVVIVNRFLKGRGKNG